MSIKRILVPMLGGDDDAAALSAALAIAKPAGGHVDALFIAADPREAVVYDTYASAYLIEQIMQAAAEASAKRRQATRAVFDKLVAEHGATLSDKPGKSGLTASYVERTGAEDRWVIHHGRLCDLIVLGQTPKRDPADLGLAREAALRESGRPVLLTPRALPSGFAKTIAIAWNGSIEAARCVGFAMPLLEQAAKIVLLTVEGDTRYGPKAAELGEYLAWHGIATVVQSLPAAGHDQGKALLAAAQKHGADLMLLGAYTRGELRRLVFGGVTGALLADSSLPLLMMH